MVLTPEHPWSRYPGPQWHKPRQCRASAANVSRAVASAKPANNVARHVCLGVGPRVSRGWHSLFVSLLIMRYIKSNTTDGMVDDTRSGEKRQCDDGSDTI